jgi:hypothetical protein
VVCDRIDGVSRLPFTLKQLNDREVGKTILTLNSAFTDLQDEVDAPHRPLIDQLCGYIQMLIREVSWTLESPDQTLPEPTLTSI